MKFELGHCVATRNAIELMKLRQVDPLQLLIRHANGDDGDLCEYDKSLNAEAIETGQSRIFSSYALPDGDHIWVITEWDRSLTTILLPDDY